MKRSTLKQILEKHYHSEDSIKSILSGRRKPSYEVMFKINKSDNVPFTAWKDIKSFINESVTKDKNNNEVQNAS